MRSIFGWDLPPGAADDPGAPWNQKEGPCDVCGLSVDDCICPECPECGEQGDPICYEQHGLVLSDEQRESKKRADDERRESDKRMTEYEDQMEREYEREMALRKEAGEE
ncbi:MAG: hypothetical protein PHS57_06170 [Alphaproteobacteria bacterium]|nr:hypothetical protein [Alphaproteobacteria bacterium]